MRIESDEAAGSVLHRPDIAVGSERETREGRAGDSVDLLNVARIEVGIRASTCRKCEERAAKSREKQPGFHGPLQSAGKSRRRGPLSGSYGTGRSSSTDRAAAVRSGHPAA